jgi:hypothetical protein
MPSPRAALLVRLSPDLKAKLVELAEREKRSLSKQVELLLEQSLRARRQLPRESSSDAEGLSNQKQRK